MRDYEPPPASSVSRVHWAETDRMARRLTGTTAASRRTAADPARGEPAHAA